jgi:transcriptional regulator with XRE-family HTH domain
LILPYAGGEIVKKFQYEGKSNISGDRVRELRLRARLSQAALAAKMQTEGVIVEQDVISRIESGSRIVTDYELLALTKIFQVSSDWIIGVEE